MIGLKALLPCLLLLLGGFLLIGAEVGRTTDKKEQITPRRTHAELAKKQKVSLPASERKQVHRDDLQRSKHRKEKEKIGLISRSTIISNGNNWTIVPKESVLFVPKLFQNRVNDKRHGKLVGWQEFFGMNRGWIRTLPVTIEQARGDKPLSEEFRKSLEKSGQVVVAVCKGGPISLRPPREPEVLDVKKDGPVVPPVGQAKPALGKVSVVP